MLGIVASTVFHLICTDALWVGPASTFISHVENLRLREMTERESDVCKIAQRGVRRRTSSISTATLGLLTVLRISSAVVPMGNSTMIL